MEGTAGPGDSGGPALIEVDGVPYVAGISSLGMPGKNGPGTYGAIEHYVRVSSHARWIDAVLSDPPEGEYVNAPTQGTERSVVRTGPVRGRGMQNDTVVLEEIGLLVSDRKGHVRMVGRIDNLYPDVLLEAGIRPPARVIELDGHQIKTSEELRTLFEGVGQGSRFVIKFEHQGNVHEFELEK